MAQDIVDYFHAYRPLIKDFIITSKTFIKTGHIIKFTYTGNLKEAVPDLVLVLNPKFQNKLHGIKLNQLPIGTFKSLLRKIKSERNLDEELSRPINLVDIFRMPLRSEINFPNRFYKTFISNDIRFTRYSIYRTYLINDIINPSVVQMNYKKLGLKINYADRYKEEFPIINILND